LIAANVINFDELSDAFQVFVDRKVVGQTVVGTS